MNFLSPLAGKFSRFLTFAVLVAAAVFSSAATISANPYPVKVAGSRHTLILLSDGTIVGWGPCDRGELGPVAANLQRRNWATGLVSIKLPRKAIDIAAGEDASLALLDNGTVVAWGSNYNYLLGSSGIATTSENPVRVGSLANVVQLAASGSGALALLGNGEVYAWGEKFKGKIGDGKTPAPVPGLRAITKISAGTQQLMALDTSSQVWMWGENYCGKGSRNPDLKAFSRIENFSGVVEIAAGACVSTAIKKDGSVWVWGSNGMAGFGNGQQTEGGILQLTPQPVAGIRNAVAVSSGGFGRHTLVLLKDGTLRGWGNSDWGQIGAGVAGDFQPSPVIPKISNVKTIFAVQNNSFAVKTDNTFWIWGTGSDGEFPLRVNAKIPKMLELQ